MKKIYSSLITIACVFTLSAQILDRSVRPMEAPAKEINIKDAEVFTLKNGLKVFLVEDHATPFLYYSVQLDIKPDLQGNKAGMHGMFGEVFGKITKNRSKEQLNKDIDMISLRGGVNQRGGNVYFLKKYQDQALDIMTDMLFNPIFSQEEFDLGMTKYKTALSTLGDDAGQINNRIAGALLYGSGFPSGEIETEETLNNITLADLEAYYVTYFAPNVARLVIVGDISQKEAKKMAEKHFGNWKKKEVPIAEYVIPVMPEHRKVAFVNKAGAVQSAIDVCYPIQYNLKETDYDAASVMSQILGGGGTGHLFMNLREDKSWTYGIYTNLAPGEQIGSMSLTSGRGAASVQALATDSAIYEVLKEFQLMIDKPVTEEELKNAITYRAGSFSRSLAESETMARFAINIDKYNLPKDYYKNYLKRLAALTPADIQAAAKKYLKPGNAEIIVTGDRQYADRLAQFADDGTVQWYDYDANPIETPKAQTVDISAEEIINNYLNAIGGKDLIAKINDYKLTGTTETMGQAISLEQYFKKPNLLSQVMTMQGVLLQKIAFDGKVLHIDGMSGKQDQTEGTEYESMKNNPAETCIDEVNYLIGYEMLVEGIESINGADAYIVKVSRNGTSKTEYYDVKTTLKVRTTGTVETQAGEITTLTDYDDYREVEGVKFPFLMKQTGMGQSFTTTVSSIEINKGVENSVFQ